MKINIYKLFIRKELGDECIISIKIYGVLKKRLDGVDVHVLPTNLCLVCYVSIGKD